MKIICVEEHLNDANIGKAIQPTLAVEAPYFTTWATEPELQLKHTDNLPHLVSPGCAFSLSQDAGKARLEEMNAHGIDMQILSYASGSQWLAPSEAPALTREANERLAEIVKANPDRFGAFSTLPWSAPEAAAAELEYAVHKLGFKGALITGRPGKTFLDDPHYSPVLAAAEALEVPVYVHPGVPLRGVQEAYYAGLDPVVSARLSMFGWGWHAECGVHILRMILGGVFDKYPKLQIVAGHWGEMVPFFLARLDESLPPQITRLSRTITETFVQHVFVTPSGMLQLPHLQFILQVLGAERVIYSVDYPYLTNDGARAFLEGAPISQDDKEKIAHRNVEQLLRIPNRDIRS